MRTSPICLDSDDIQKSSRPEYAQSRQKKMVAFDWYGGKVRQIEWISCLLPNCKHYVEPFCGAASILLNRDPVSAETINDLDGDLVTFFRVLRDQPDELIRKLTFTPIAREEYYKAIYLNNSSIDDLERARFFYIRARQTIGGLAQTASLGRWAQTLSCSRNAMSGMISRWQNGLPELFHIANRLLRVQIENRPALEMLQIYDRPETLFYCDPPYLTESRVDPHGYAYELNQKDYEDFAVLANRCIGKIALSGYDHPIMDQLFPPDKWHKNINKEHRISLTHGVRQEVVWTNYDPLKSRRGLFSNLT